MVQISTAGDVFEMRRDMIDVTSISRPDTSWRVTDAQGHVHQWYVDTDICRHCGHPSHGHVRNERIGGGDIWWICPEQRLVDRLEQMTRYERREPVPAAEYNPSHAYVTPTLLWVKTGIGYFEDGEPYDIGHYECRLCGEQIENPRGCADQWTQYIPGLAHYRINGESVSPEEFQRRYLAALPKQQ